MPHERPAAALWALAELAASSATDQWPASLGGRTVAAPSPPPKQSKVELAGHCLAAQDVSELGQLHAGRSFALKAAKQQHWLAVRSKYSNLSAL